MYSIHLTAEVSVQSCDPTIGVVLLPDLLLTYYIILPFFTMKNECYEVIIH